jgi:hypothetical protein
VTGANVGENTPEGDWRRASTVDLTPKNTCLWAAEKSTLRPCRFKHLLTRRSAGFWAESSSARLFSLSD